MIYCFGDLEKRFLVLLVLTGAFLIIYNLFFLPSAMQTGFGNSIAIINLIIAPPFIWYGFTVPAIKIRSRPIVTETRQTGNDERIQYFLQVDKRRAKPVEKCRAVPFLCNKLGRTWKEDCHEITYGASACWRVGVGQNKADPQTMESRTNIDGEKRLLLFELSKGPNQMISFWAFEEGQNRPKLCEDGLYQNYASKHLRIEFESRGEAKTQMKWSKKIANIRP